MPYSDDIIMSIHAQNQIRAALRRSARTVRKFNRLRRLHLLGGVPAGQWGGTFLYCRHKVEVKVPKLDKLGRKTGRFTLSTGPCSQRFRSPKSYRRHWHSVHEGA